MHQRIWRAVTCSVVVWALAAGGCSSLPTAPATGAAGFPRGSDPLGGLPAVSDSTADVPILSALGGLAMVNGYMVQVPAGALGRDATMHLRVNAADRTLDVSFTPANVTLSRPLVLTASLAGVLAGDMGNYTICSILGNTWTRVPGSKLLTYSEVLQAPIPSPGRYGIGSWSDLWPGLEVAETAAEVSSSFGGSVSCGGVRVDVPAGALRDNGTVTMRWSRADNVVDLGITPIDLNGFEQPVTLTMDATALPAGQRALAVVYWWNPEEQTWEEVPGSVADPATGRVSAPLHHFSQYTVGLQSKAGWGSLPNGRPMTQ